jgi:hypothetical protein
MNRPSERSFQAAEASIARLMFLQPKGCAPRYEGFMGAKCDNEFDMVAPGSVDYSSRAFHAYFSLAR